MRIKPDGCFSVFNFEGVCIGHEPEFARKVEIQPIKIQQAIKEAFIESR